MKLGYQYSDPDGDSEDTAAATAQWFADGTLIADETQLTFTPTSAQNKKFLTASIRPASLPPADPAMATTASLSAPLPGPILPPRAELASSFIKSPNTMSWGDAYMHCAALGERLPSEAELKALFTTYTRANAVGEDSQGDINRTYGWPGPVYWTSIAGDQGRHKYVYLPSDGHTASNLDTNRYPFACATSGSGEGLPTVSAVSFSNPIVGTKLTATYTYNGNSTIPDRSRFQWHTSTAANGTTGKAPIPGATSSSYTPVSGDAGKWLVLEITPASYDTVIGTPVSTVSSVAVAAPPSISNVRISGYDQWGTPQIGGTLKGEYDFNSNGSNATDTSTYRWLNGSKSSTSRTYTLTEADVGKTLTFEVTAKSSEGLTGNTLSAPTNKRVSIFKRFIKPDKTKYPRINPPLAPGGDPAEMECTFSGARLPSRNELTTLFKDETSGGTNTTLCEKYDWPMAAKCGGSGNESRYWTSEKTSAGQEAYHVNLTNGQVSKTYIGNAFYVACINR
ncbi:DUF1566 domain-containing protein [Pseudomonas resinovorans]|uniref:DUF1566 domain-containing protein n=1 Tax=Metapseudomonas resinovorans TaxID=53412 RepID=A0ABT4YBT6_METRE|nr:hypothetical protein [Pseudomonas resinovorans]MDA8486361.1 DUF1566 domain-containing protein [Pseudomonas resinovorans]